jgi:hypothetical protein
MQDRAAASDLCLGLFDVHKAIWFRSRTIDGLALCQIAVVLAGQEAVAIATNDTFDVAI